MDRGDDSDLYYQPDVKRRAIAIPGEEYDIFSPSFRPDVPQLLSSNIRQIGNVQVNPNDNKEKAVDGKAVPLHTKLFGHSGMAGGMVTGDNDKVEAMAVDNMGPTVQKCLEEVDEFKENCTERCVSMLGRTTRASPGPALVEPRIQQLPERTFENILLEIPNEAPTPPSSDATLQFFNRPFALPPQHRRK